MLFDKWEGAHTDIESLKRGLYPRLDEMSGVIVDSPTIRRKWFPGWSGYRGYARFVMNRQGILIYEYLSMGAFAVFCVPLKSISKVMYEAGHSPADVKVIGLEDNELAAFRSNDPSFFKTEIERMLAQKP